uniref:Uncharacterized protein n=1 Tax=Physcomitrium patens TaxID=3218 RepID=A0A2K1L8N7_PHYPA|nr:hypothetical protein PHYPA_000788 [Physcomitrium patens]
MRYHCQNDVLYPDGGSDKVLQLIYTRPLVMFREALRRGYKEPKHSQNNYLLRVLQTRLILTALQFPDT